MSQVHPDFARIYTVFGLSSNHSLSTLLANVEGLKRRCEEDSPLADRYRFLREPKACAPVTLPEEQWIVVGLASHEDVLSGEDLDKAIDNAMNSKSYTFNPEDGPLLCYQVGDQDWVAAQNPDQALAVLAEHNGDWLHENSDDYDVVLTGEAELDQLWQDEDEPGVPAGSLRQWLGEATEPCYLIGTE
ncbi:Hypothetical protein PSEBR_a3848 [Pseudomonas brassicacearum subsp. brassicacearum NFM421]|uniref:Uncharacterized protein n=1 Tax=Pseudomonas brassicacearum (strain NFM421) TaxID=994484 RepID=F2KJL0_PSEBN|nr:hypothetical protein [Pseudomonas brassicacearum]AEA70236.1 Hypothetical protein PSEBR_a3848 [Pseudomonas brassicacearum subsp. brassicacearum NFM421]